MVALLDTLGTSSSVKKKSARASAEHDPYPYPQVGTEEGTSTTVLQAEAAEVSDSYEGQSQQPQVSPLEQRFRRLAEEWRSETQFSSSITDMVLNPNYQRIIGMGDRAISFLLSELANSPDHWFWALRSITDENPVLDEHQGDVDKMSEDWRNWGEEHGYL
jgi:hypothetical protein